MPNYMVQTTMVRKRWLEEVKSAYQYAWNENIGMKPIWGKHMKDEAKIWRIDI